MAQNERTYYALADHPEFPGSFAEAPDMKAFAFKLRQAAKRWVPCKFQFGAVTVQGQFDLVSGHAYLSDNGRFRIATELTGDVDIVFSDAPYIGLRYVHIDEGFVNVQSPLERPAPSSLWTLLNIKPLGYLPAAQLANITEALATAGKLPPL